MIRTKHILILGALILGVLLGILVTVIATKDNNRVSNVVDEVIFSSGVEVIGVSVQSGETSENVRASLIQKLIALGPHEEEVVEIIEVAEEEQKIEATNAARILNVVRDDGSTVSVSLPTKGIQTFPLRELTSNIVGVSTDGTFMNNNSVLVYADSAGSHVLDGYALDGFGIYSEIVTTDLDVCQGHTHNIIWDGFIENLYHYHISSINSRALGCFSGEPINLAPYLE